MTRLTSRAVLSTNRLFSGLPDSLLDRLSDIAVREDVARGKLIFSQGEPGEVFYGIASGRVRVSATSPDGREMHIVEMGPGDSFGEIALLDGGVRTASAVVVDNASLFKITRSTFLPLLSEEPALALKLLERLCDRLRWTNELVEDISFLSVRAHIAKRVWLLAEQFGTDTSSGRELRLPQGDLATFLGLSRQAVNTHLQEWRSDGMLETARGRIVITDAVKFQSEFADSTW